MNLNSKNIAVMVVSLGATAVVAGSGERTASTARSEHMLKGQRSPREVYNARLEDLDGLTEVVSRSFDESSKQTFLRPEPREIDAVIESISARPDLTTAIAPNASEDDMARVFSGVRRFLEDPHLLADAFSRIEEKKISFTQSNTTDEKTLSQTPPFTSWGKLREQFKCSICLDLYCVPVITSCSHSFCYNCLVDVRCSNVLANDLDLLHQCPQCRSREVGSIVYEKSLDDEILRQVVHIDSASTLTPEDMHEKNEWISKRALAYSQYMKARALLMDDDRDDGKSSAHDSSPAYLIDVVFIIAASAICILLFLRRRRS